MKLAVTNFQSASTKQNSTADRQRAIALVRFAGTSITSNRRFLWAGLLATVLLCGCNSGPKLGEVTGIVKLDGKPVSGARVTFHPETGRVASAKTDENGAYELHFSYGRDGALVGKHRVTIETFQEASAYEGFDATPAVPELFHEQFNTATILEREISRGSNEVNFDLTSDGKENSHL